MKQKWECKRIEDVCDKASSNIAQNKIKDISGNYPVYGASGFVQNVDFYHRDSEYIGVVKDGAGVGRIGIYPAFSSLLGTMQYILPKEGNSLPFIAYALKKIDLASFSSGATIPHIYFKDYGKCKIPVPPRDVQERIVEELDLLTSVIDKQKAQLQELDTLAQSIFYDMFGDPIDNPKGWNVNKWNKVFKLKSGDGLTAKNFVEGAYPVYGGNGISGYHNTFNKEGGFIVIGRVGAYCGNVRYVRGQFWLTDNAFELFFDSRNYNYDFLCYMLNLYDLHRFANQAAQPVISNTGLKDIDVILPPLSLQQSFAEKIASIEKQKAALTKSIEESQKLLDYTMDKYFG